MYNSITSDSDKSRCFPLGIIPSSCRAVPCRYEFRLICLSKSSSFSTIFPRMKSVNPRLSVC